MKLFHTKYYALHTLEAWFSNWAKVFWLTQSMSVNVDDPLIVLPGQYHLLMIVETPFLVWLICCVEYPGRKK